MSSRLPDPALLPALEPSHSVVVEACAGSGKTWLLVSRMLRLMLAGAEPSELLAITFTRRAAEEMRSRLDDWLRDLALLPDDDAVDFLLQRGLDPAEARAALPRARGLLEAVLTARPGPLLTTFHGWFFHLLEHAPLPRRQAGEVLEQTALLRDEAWLALTQLLGRRPDAPPARAFVALTGQFSLDGLQELLDDLLARRAEWWSHGGDPELACSRLASQLGLTEDTDLMGALFAAPGLRAEVQAYGRYLAREAASLTSRARQAASLQAALDAWDTAPEACFGHLCAALLTDKGEPRVLKPGKTMVDRLGEVDARHYADLHQRLAERLGATRQRLAEQRGLWLNRLGLTLGQAWLRAYQDLKAERAVLDFTDAELETARLLADEDAAAAVFMKLDVRWKHVLLDEFQDTNPLQWRILRAWLEAYGQDGARPTVFLVGDPKQSIYRFRRAEPRLFHTAAAWLTARYGARYLPQNETRRCAPRVVAWLNALFDGRPEYPGFERHRAHQTGLPGWCELHVTAPADRDLPPPSAYRLPLTTPPPSTPHRRAHEAAWVARRIRDVVGGLLVRDPQDGTLRPARYGDITLLYATRADIAVFEDACKAAGIPFVTDRRGELLATLEARDLTALLTWLVDPRDDLALAHVLRTPFMGLTDEDLLALADAPGPDWWSRLDGMARGDTAPSRVRRAQCLLQGWREQAGRLPIHDLLDRIHHEGDVSAHYARTLPAHLRPGVLANLQGFLALSLSLSGGRYPSLPRFLDELRRLREKAGKDGPGEPPAAAGERVRMLTIHSAKGLESPVVFLIKADACGSRDRHSGVLLDWPPEADRPTHFSLYGPRDWRGPGRDALFRQERELARVERLNLLYVAMTRARQALFVSGVAQDDPDREAGWLEPLATALKHADSAGLPEMAWLNTPRPGDTEDAPPPDPLPPDIPPIGNHRPAQDERAAFGTLLHAWLEHRGNGLTEDTITALLDMDEEQAAHVAALGQRILALPELAPAFDPSRYLRAHNELEYLDAQGRVARMDRLVEFAREVWVLDYKSGGLHEPDPVRRAQPHLQQITAYHQAAQVLYPDKRIRSVLVFTDGMVHWL
ncbi:MAG TPA: UvrD-helicase domain-containing protein [Thiobacillaceae bacterium]|nr:UvrD-helicase domain-containing protein [Thiobacillaceae bacterium]HNU64501.1 UvrD-helicase domain-containing protein [Thiobacillaceae bacterium]